LLLHIVARGKIGRSPEGELVERYLRRIGWPTKVSELPDKGGRMPPREAGTIIVALDEKGAQLGSVAFAERLGRWRDEGRRIGQPSRW
jgi:23S rRNA (pseudouridine1915-N3)-methyltransferase